MTAFLRCLSALQTSRAVRRKQSCCPEHLLLLLRVPEQKLRLVQAAVADLLKQDKLARERSATTLEARLLARRRAAASFSAKGVVDEILQGVSQIRYLQQEEKRFAADSGAELKALVRLVQNLRLVNKQQCQQQEQDLCGKGGGTLHRVL